MSLSLTWGGADNILVPVSAGGEPRAEFRSILRADDPDYVAAYEATVSEIALGSPSRYEGWLAGRPPSESLRSEFEQEMSTVGGWYDLSEAVRVARSWCSPYESTAGHYPKPHKGGPIGWPLIPLSAFPGLLSHPLDLDLGAFDPSFELMVRMRFGGLLGAVLPHQAALTQCVADAQDGAALGELACTNQVSRFNLGPGSSISHLEALHATAIPPIAGVDGLSPFRRATHGMDRIRFDIQETWVVVIGETCEDFCFALACDRLLPGGASWLPTRLIGHPSLIPGLHALKSLVRDTSGHGNNVVFTSLSLESAAVNESRLAVLSMELWAADQCSTVVTPDSVSFDRPKRLADPGSLHLGETSFCYREEDGSLNLGTALITPIPEVAREVHPSAVSWEIDVTVEREQAPARSALGPVDLLSRPDDNPDVGVRSAGMGLVYHSHMTRGIFLSGWALEQHLVRPSLRVPSAAAVVSRLATAAGRTVRPSQTGRLNQLVIDMWGGLEAAAADLSGPTWKLLDTLTPRDGVTDGPRPTSLVVQRIPYVTISHAHNLLGCDEEATTRGELDRLLQLGVLRRGLILRCGRCNWLDWYAIEDIGRSFRCVRCPHDNFLEQARWRDPVTEPNWYYDLDHAVGEALNLNGQVPILALDWLRSRYRKAFSFTTDFEVLETPDMERPPEVDFAVLGEGRLILGEAKKNGRLGNDRASEDRKIRRLGEVARILSADAVCLATSAVAWNTETLAAASGAFSALGIDLLQVQGMGTEQ